MLLRFLSICLFLPASAFAQDTTWAADHATELVDPFVGTGGHGHTFPGACVPFGMVQLSPDTRTDPQEWDGCGGYHFSDSLIYGFSHTHLSGTGVSDLCDVLLMPLSGKRTTDPTEYRSRFAHQREAAHAGYYSVFLEDPDIDVDLTATKRTGMQRYRFGKAGERSIVLDLRHRDRLLASSIVQTGPNEISGERRSNSWAADQHLFFCIRINGGKVLLDLELSDSTKAVILLPDGQDEVLVKVGISAVSAEGARRNLEAENPGWDFHAVRKLAEAAWNKELRRIEVQGGSREQQRVFYTALYHSLLVPYLFSDVDGRYRGHDGQVHQADHDVYSLFSLWDTFRAEHPLLTILEPARTTDFIRSFLLQYQQAGRLPVWELWGNETDCMIGYHSVSVIADAYLKGIRGFDADLALEAMVASAMRDEPGLNAYREQGFISSEDQSESVSRTLEYAYDDWCIAQMAKAMGRDSLAHAFFDRASNWRNVYDPTTGFFHGRHNGAFKTSFDPYEVNFDFTEANAWHYSTFVPHDVDGLDRLLRATGHGGLEQQLDEVFQAHTATTGRDQSDISGMLGQYAHGNEPSHAMAWMYRSAGRPDKAQDLVGRVLTEFYHDAPDGLIGNEDCGQMSAWYVLSALGLYPIAPGDDRFQLQAPLFPAYRLHLADGKVLRVRRTGSITEGHVVQSTVLNGSMGRLDELPYATLMAGGDLEIRTGPVAESGRREAGTPVSKQQLMERTGWFTWRPSAPVITPSAPAFTAPMSIALASLGQGDRIHYTLDGNLPDADSPLYTGPFGIGQSCTVRAVAMNGRRTGPVVSAHFERIDPLRTIQVETPWNNQYAAGGEMALIDGQRGAVDWRTGGWQGYTATDLVATIDMGRVVTLKDLGLSVLQDQRSWIWYPASVQFAWSTNGRTWSSTTVQNTVPQQADGTLTTVMKTGAIGKKARWIKLTAKSAGPCPPWHYGHGQPAHIFTDELLIGTE
jgi:predicted alpha-1,2-mannosidase